MNDSRIDLKCIECNGLMGWWHRRSKMITPLKRKWSQSECEENAIMNNILKIERDDDDIAAFSCVDCGQEFETYEKLVEHETESIE
jgi:hypothetical protein